MDKKLFYELSDNADVSKIVMDLDGCMEFIKGDIENYSPTELQEIEYTLHPIWLTDNEFNNLPEANF